MVKNELVKRSPVRILEKSISGGLGKGGIGVISSKKGVGKTACLVHLAADKLLQERNVIHVSFSSRTDHIINWYEDIFKELEKKKGNETIMALHDEIIKRRVIMNFNQEMISPEQIAKSLKAMVVDGHFSADTIIVDGFDFNKSSLNQLKAFSQFAKENNMEVWFSASSGNVDPKRDSNGVPEELKQYLDVITVLLFLNPIDDHIRIELVKDHGHFHRGSIHLKLDSKSLLIAEGD